MSVLTTAPWRRALLLGLRQPRLTVAAAGAAAVLGFVAATPSIFASSVSSATLNRQLSPVCRGLSIDPANTRFPTDVVRDASVGAPGFDPAITTAAFGTLHPVPTKLRAGDKVVQVLAVSRTDATQHLHAASGGGAAASGAWITTQVADQLGVKPGSAVTVVAANGSDTAPLTIAATYGDITRAPLDSFWCPLKNQIVTNLLSETDERPPMMVVDQPEFDRLLEATHAFLTYSSIEVPLHVVPHTLTEARRAIGYLDGLDRRVAAGVGARADAVQHELDTNPPTDDPSLYNEHSTLKQLEITRYSANSRLRFAAARAAAVRHVVTAAHTPTVIVALVVAIGLLGATAVSWVDRRRTEVTLLGARGVSPLAIGVKGAAELALPLLVGGALGWLAAALALPHLGPSPDLDPGIVATGARWAALATVASIVVVTASVALALRVGPDRRRRRVPVPWEIPVLALAVWSFDRLRTHGLPKLEGANLPPIDHFALAFPLLLFLGVLGLAVRVGRLLLALARRRRRGRGVVRWLAARRLVADPRATVVLFGATAFAIAVSTYGAAVVRSTEATIAAKGGVEAGARSVAGVTEPPALPRALAGRATVVGYVQSASLGSTQVDVLAVDPATFRQGAFWDPSFADRPLAELLGRLGPQPDGRVAALLVGAGPGSGTLTLPRHGGPPQEITVVGHADVFPGLTRATPLVVVSSAAAPAVMAALPPLVWSSLDEHTTVAALQASGAQTLYSYSATTKTDTSAALATLWTFGVVRTVGALVGVLTIVGLLAYVDARQRARALAYALARRMGLSRARNWRALTTEIGVVVALATAGGITLGIVTGRMVSPHVDALADQPPPAMLRLPVTAAVMTVGIAVVVVLVVSSFAQRAADRVDLAEVLRQDV